MPHGGCFPQITVRADVVREDGVGHKALLRVGRVRLEVGGTKLVVVGGVLERVAHLVGKDEVRGQP